MTPEIILVFSILGGAILIFITNKVRMDLVGILVLSTLAISGVISPHAALSGFSNPAVITVWAVLILSGGLARTGLASKLGKFFLRLAGDNEVKLLAIIMLTSGIMSSFMNSIGVASLFLPVVIDIAHQTKRSPSRFLMPLAFSSLLGGLNTLIGTPPNILVSEALRDNGFAPFQIFDFTPVGLIILISGTLYMILAGRHLLPEKDITRDLGKVLPDVTELYDFQERMAFIQLPEGSPLHGKSLQESRLGAALELNVVTILRDQQTVLAPSPDFILRTGDRLLVQGQLDRLFGIHAPDHHFLDQEQHPIEKIYSADVQLAEATVTPGSSLTGLTLPQAAFRHAYHVIVLAIRRNDKIHYTNLESIHLLEGDTLLIKGRQEHLNDLQGDDDLTLTIPESFQQYQLEDHLIMVSVPNESSLVGYSLVSSRLGDAFGFSVQGIIRQDHTELMPSPNEILQAGDILIIKGKPEDLQTIQGLQKLEIETRIQPDLTALETDETGLIEAILSPHSTLFGKAVRELDFRAKYGLTILAIWREGRAYRSHLRDMKLRLGDAMLLFGPHRRLQIFSAEPDFLVLSEKALPAPRIEKAPIALSIMALVLIPVIFNWIPIAITAVAGVALMVLTGCLNMDEAYHSIEWKAVFLIAGMLPLGIALEQTGAAQLISDNMLLLLGNASPIILTAGLFLLATLASQVMPNSAVAVLLAPIALSAAADLGISPYPLMMTVAVSSSAAFLSPVGHASNLLVMGPGGYRFSDYFKVGFPLTILVLIIVLLVIPIFWPY
ncbi:MAG: SLC13 family permease [Anaerolineales bacterium]|nr:SLC13 family permease [Anaerolineales bacterium]